VETLFTIAWNTHDPECPFILVLHPRADTQLRNWDYHAHGVLKLSLRVDVPLIHTVAWRFGACPFLRVRSVDETLPTLM